MLLRRGGMGAARACDDLAMITLHYFPGNASFTPHVLLHEIGTPFELALVDRANNAHKSPAYLQLNPNGTIPVYVEDGLVLYESAAICLHLAETHPQAALAPVVPVDRAHFHKWLMWLTNTLQATLMLYFYPERWVDEGNAEGAAQLKAHAEARVGAMLDILDAHLAGQGGPWMLGAQYSLLDPYALVLGLWTRGFARPARSLAHLGPYLQRVLARPAVARAFASEKLPQPLV
jgi:glutathione S-transferase